MTSGTRTPDGLHSSDSWPDGGSSVAGTGHSSIAVHSALAKVERRLLDLESLLLDARSDSRSSEEAVILARLSEVQRSIRHLLQDSASVGERQNGSPNSECVEFDTQRLYNDLAMAQLEADRARLAAQQLADTLVGNADDGVFVFSSTQCVACNDSATRMVQAPRAHLLNTSPLRSLLGSDPRFEHAADERGAASKDAHAELFDTLLAAVPCRVEARLQTADGTGTWVETIFTRSASSSPGMLAAITRNITDRKRKELEESRRNTFLLDILNSLPIQIAVRDGDGKIVLANRPFCQTHATDQTRLQQDSKESKRIRELLETIFSVAPDPGQCELFEQGERTVNLPYDSSSVFAARRTLYREPHTSQSYVISTFRDITQERLKDARIRLLGSVFDHAREGIAVLDQDGVILEVNPAFALNAGSINVSYVGRRIDSVLKWSLTDFPPVLSQVLRGDPWSGRVNVKSLTGSERSFLLSLTPTLDGTSQRIMALFSDVTELDQTQRRLQRQALYDNVTGLPNRRFCRDQIRSQIESCDGTDSRFAVCFLDLDDFKHVNDSLGHHAGDQLLEAVARKLRRYCGQGGFVARFGGDEFAMVIPDVSDDLSGVRAVTESILKAVRQPFRVGQTEVFVSVSIGITVFPDHARDVDSLLRNADLAMYAAKEAGKNRTCFFEPELQSEVEGRHRIQNQLRRALQGNEIRVHYQPQICARTGRLIGCEALARWRTSDGRDVAPTDFVPIAEQSGLIVPLGEFVLLTACRQARSWFASGLTPPRIAVNVSPQQLRHPRFVERVEQILEEAGAEPEWIEIEITENAVMDNVQEAIRILDRLAGLGLTLAIDDFGTGHSSLNYLKWFRIHTLKIDSSFIRDLPHDETAAAIVQSVVSLGKGRGLTVVAEGVETRDQLDFVTKLGCDVIQGFLFSRALSDRDFEHWQATELFQHLKD